MISDTTFHVLTIQLIHSNLTDYDRIIDLESVKTNFEINDISTNELISNKINEAKQLRDSYVNAKSFWLLLIRCY